MKCIFDLCELWNGLLFGILSSAVFAMTFHYGRGYFYFKRRKGKLAGSYNGYGYKADGSGELDEKTISSATIQYLAENKLEITVSHNHLTWVGEITMNSLKYGSIVFQYENEEARHFFGFKKCIVDHARNMLFVIGEAENGYGTEVFKRVSI
jgi:hypothetical protein